MHAAAPITRPVIALATILVAAAAAIASGPAMGFDLPQWQSALERDHPLTGKAFDANGRAAVLNGIIEHMAGADFVILGETHDNRDHHSLQAAFIEAIAESGTNPAIVLEMVPRAMQPRIDTFLGEARQDASRFGELVDWQERGWPDWSAYQPILEIAISRDLPVIAGNVARTQIGEIHSNGTDSFGDALTARYGLDRPLPEAASDALIEALTEGHCGHLPESQSGPMQSVQRLRDGSMSDAMITASRQGNKPVILIAGSGHARRDFGVPFVLSRLAPRGRTVSLALMEADGEGTGPEDYLAPPGEARLHDYILVTPRAEREDPCKAFLERMNSKAEDG